MKKLVLLMLMGILVVGVGTVVYGTQTASHTVTVTVSTVYDISAPANVGIAAGPLDAVEQSGTGSLTWKHNNSSSCKIQISADSTAGLAIFTLKVASGATVGGSGSVAAAFNDTAGDVTTTPVSFITGIAATDAGNLAGNDMTWAAKPDWAEAGPVVVTVSYHITTE